MRDGLAQATKIVNNSYNRVIGMSPNEAAVKYSDPEETKKLIVKYNKHREKADTDRRKPLKEGDNVRIVLKGSKATSFYKAYRGKQYTKEGHPVNESNKGHFKDKDISKETYEVLEVKGQNPTKYKIKDWFKKGGDKPSYKWFKRDKLSEPMPPKDMKSEALLKQRAKGKPKKKPPKEMSAEEAKEEEKMAEVQHKTKPTAVPSKKAKVHAFIDQADAELQGDKLRKQVDKFIKTYDDLPKKLHKRFTRKMKKHIAYWDYQYQHVKGALRSDFKDRRETWKSLLKKFEKNIKIQ